MTLVEVLAFVGGSSVMAAVASGVTKWLCEKPTDSKKSAELVTAAGAFQAALNVAAEGIVSRLEGQITHLNDRVDELERENDDCRREGEQLRQANRQLEQRLDSLMRQLRNPASTQPGGSLSDAVIELSDGDVKVRRVGRRDRRTPPVAS